VPSLPRLPLEFRAEVNHEETRVMGLSNSKDPVIVALVVLALYQRVTDGQTDGQTTDRQTYRFAIANTALSYADAL